MKKIFIDMLTEKTVNIIIAYYAEIDGETLEIKRTRKAYNNSNADRTLLLDEIGEPYTTAIFAIWGDTPLIED